MNPRHDRCDRYCRPTGQRGVVLFIVLIALVIMSFAGIALMRTLNTGNALAGNLAFRASAVQSTDLAVERARVWLIGQTQTALFADIGNAYLASTPQNFQVANWDWDNKAVQLTSDSGETVSYLIQRMCAAPGNFLDPVTQCMLASTAVSGGDSKKVYSYGEFNKFGAASGVPYYRVTTRSVGPRNTVAYVQVMIY